MSWDKASCSGGQIIRKSATFAEYRYDGQGRRIAKLIPDGENWDRTDYLYNENWQCLEERSLVTNDKEQMTNDPSVQWLWDPRYVDAPVLRWRDADNDSNHTLEEALYFTTDANNNVTALVKVVSGAGRVVERYMYDAYGKATVLNGETGYDGGSGEGQAAEWSADADNKSDWGNEVLYAGYRLDAESGMFQVRNRNYHPTLGRWIERDPAGYVDGMSLYQYCRSNPATGTDPSGLVLTVGGPATWRNAEMIRDKTLGLAATGYWAGVEMSAQSIVYARQNEGVGQKALGYAAAGGSLLSAVMWGAVGSVITGISPDLTVKAGVADYEADRRRGVSENYAASDAFGRNAPGFGLLFRAFEAYDYGYVTSGVNKGKRFDGVDRAVCYISLGVGFTGTAAGFLGAAGLDLAITNPKSLGARTLNLQGAVDISEAKRLRLDPSIGDMPRPGEGGTAAELQSVFGPLERGKIADYDICSGANAGKQLDLMFTPDTGEAMNGINSNFGRNWAYTQAEILDHYGTADLVAMDMRNLTPANQMTVTDFVGTLSPEKQSKTLFLSYGESSSGAGSSWAGVGASALLWSPPSDPTSDPTGQ